MYLFLRKTVTNVVRSGAVLLGLGVMACLPTVAMAQPADPGDPADEATIQKGLEVLRDVAKAYRADFLTDHIDAYVKDPLWSERTVEFDLRFGTGTTAAVELERMMAVCVDDVVYVIDHRVPSLYATLPVDGDLALSLTTDESDQKFNLPHFALRRATTDEDLVEAVTRYMGPGGVVNYELRENSHGKKQHVIKMKGEEGHQEVFVDVDTNFIDLIDIASHPKDTGGKFHVRLDMNTKQHEGALPTPIEIKIVDRTPVSSVADLILEAPEIGDRAADLVARDLEGNRISIPVDDGKLHIVVFWSSENSACDRMMPKVNNLAQWADLDKLPVKVTGVNVAENVFDAERLELVDAYWETGQYAFDTVIDMNNVVFAAYAVKFLPQVCIIDRAGVLRKVFYGPDDRLDEKVRFSVEEVLRESVGKTGG